MKQSKKKSVALRATAVALAAVLMLSSGTTVFAGKTFAESTNFKEQIKLDDVLYDANYYSDYLLKKEKDFSDYEGSAIEMSTSGFSASEGAAPEIKTLEGKENVLYISNDNQSVSWQVNIETAGFYQFNMEYLAIDGNGLAVSRAILIDGESLYDELDNIKLYRHWVDSEKPRTNNLGDQVRPSQLENQEWIKTAIYDAQGEYPQPLKVGLTAGVHTITLKYIDQPLAISSFKLEAPDKIKSYADVLKEYKNKGYKNASDSVRFEAEYKDNIVYKTDSGITIGVSSDSTLTAVDIDPKYAVTHNVFNHVAGSSWKAGNQEIQWKFSVKESGLYKLSARLYQAFGNGVSSTRQIKIDGVVPFEEFNEFVFKYDADWKTQALSDEEGNPYLIYLEKGDHTISMRVVMGELTEVIHNMNEITSMYSNAIRNITMITGQSPDLNYDYRLERQIPTLLGDLQKIVDLLVSCRDTIDVFSSKQTPAENNLTMSIELLEKMIEMPSKIPAGLSDLTSSLTNIGTWLNELKVNSFGLDYISFVSPDEEVINEKSSVWDTLYALFANFILSYQKDYNAIGSMGESNEEYESIDVWVSRGKEWCEILKDMVDNTFTKEHKINVNLNILPSGSLGGGTSPLLLAINAGTEPDVVVGLDSSIPVDYAIRGSMYDLAKFKDFKEVEKRFLPSTFMALKYHGGVYGLPETTAFNAMFYRTDIFEQLDLKVPENWDQICDDLLPQLYQYNMQFSYGGDVSLRIFQNGGKYYSETGYSTALDTPEALKGFTEHVEMYTELGCPVAASFLNRFRSGEMPIGIAGFDFYLQLVYAAPELTGKWKMIPMPYNVLDDGTKNDKVPLGTASSVSMLSTCENPEASWEFMKWYTSEETQANYGRQIESILGIQSRWTPSNLAAFRKLPWSKEELEVIENCWSRSTADQAVLGGYITTRSIGNAINRCIINGDSPRESMEQCVEEINIELRRKQEMYNINPEGLK